jgi:hypothetical protein
VVPPDTPGCRDTPFGNHCSTQYGTSPKFAFVLESAEGHEPEKSWETVKFNLYRQSVIVTPQPSTDHLITILTCSSYRDWNCLSWLWDPVSDRPSLDQATRTQYGCWHSPLQTPETKDEHIPIKQRCMQLIVSTRTGNVYPPYPLEGWSVMGTAKRNLSFPWCTSSRPIC